MQSSPPFSCPAARMPQRACSQATLWYFRWLSCKIPCVADIIILSPVSNICKAVPMALFWVTNILMDSTKKTEKRFKFLFNLTGIFNSQSCHALKSWYTGGVQEQTLQHWLADRLSQKVYHKNTHFEVKVKQCNNTNGSV